MKTQLLEDIGESAALSILPSKIAGDPKAGKQRQNGAPGGKTESASPRFAGGAWRQKPGGEPPISAEQQTDQPAKPLELNSLFEEIAALEAQYVAPSPQHAPVTAPVESEHALSASAAAPTLASYPAHTGAAPQDPLFDFTLPSQERQATDPFTRPPAWPARSRLRYFLWGAGVLSAVLLIQGGRSLYEARKDAGPPAAGILAAKEAPRADQATRRPAITANQSTPAPDGELRVPPAVPASAPSPAVPPLVMLEPDRSAATRLEQPLPPAAAGAVPREPLKAELPADEGPASPLPKPPARKARAQPDRVAEPASDRGERGPAPRFARPSALAKETPPERDTGMAATLRACREHGYHAAQCVKRGCSLSKYGFVCRVR